MRKVVFLLLLILTLFVSIGYATVPDADFDGVADENDNCPDSITNIVDQFGCTCEQKNCPSDSNECTDDCSIIDGLAGCTFTRNDLCPSANKQKCIAAGYNWCVKGTGSGSHVENGYLDEGDYECWSECKEQTTDDGTSSPLSHCKDTDGGLNYDIKGLMKDGEDGGQWDICIGSNQLIEYYCDGNGQGSKASYKCPKGCKDGACKKKRGFWGFIKSWFS